MADRMIPTSPRASIDVSADVGRDEEIVSTNPNKTPSKPADGEIFDLLQAMHRSHLRLNVMADQKANILMGIIGIIFTVILTKINITEAYSPHIKLILVIFLSLELVAFTASLMVIAPRFQGKFLIKNIENMPNPFFFGFYTNFSEDEYINHMVSSIHDNASAKKVFYKDIYQLGQVLKRKYKLLRRAYIFAFLGVALSVILFISDALFSLIFA
ncbi:MAG: DUF5706 domain-containing protein [Oleibacter sp.]|nr:DUF5706 domain-containing protein [Thalassolituus sp.]